MGSQSYQTWLSTHAGTWPPRPPGGGGWQEGEGWEGPLRPVHTMQSPPGAVPSEQSSAVLEAPSQPHLEWVESSGKECSTSPQAMDGSTQRQAVLLWDSDHWLPEVLLRPGIFSCLCPGNQVPAVSWGW